MLSSINNSSSHNCSGKNKAKKGFDPPKGDGLFAALTRFLKGILIGIGAILPGLSGGVLSVIFKLYTPIMRFLGNPFHKFGKNILFFLPVGLGGFVGIFFFAFFVSAALGSYEAFFTCLFIGLVIGTFPSLYREAGLQGRTRVDWMYMLVSAVVLFTLMLLGGEHMVTITPNPLVWLLAGALIGLGVIVPGLSPSNFLMYFGLYKTMSDSIKSLEWGAVIPLGIGAVASILLLAQPINYLLDRHYSKIYHTILGLVIASSLAIIPVVVLPNLSEEVLQGMSLSLTQGILICMVFLVVGFILSRLFSRLESQTEQI